jgi:hypothetical protein
MRTCATGAKPSADRPQRERPAKIQKQNAKIKFPQILIDSLFRAQSGAWFGNLERSLEPGWAILIDLLL